MTFAALPERLAHVRAEIARRQAAAGRTAPVTIVAVTKGFGVDAVEAALEAGVAWAVVGTRAAVDATFLAEVCGRFPGRIIVAADAKGDRVAIRGWTERSELTVTELGLRARAAGAAALLYTDVSRDGTELGPNVEATGALAQAVRLPVLASGGVARLEDLTRLARVPGVLGTVVGRALYTGAIDLAAALAALRAA